jgi:hypothetical protein
MSQTTPTLDPLNEKVKNLIKDWMEENGVYKNDDMGSKNVTFQLNGVTNIGIAFAIIQPISPKRTVVVIARIDFGSEKHELLKNIPTAERDEFLFGLKRDLVFESPDFKFEPSIPRFIRFSKEITFDELNEGKIREALERITRCVLWSSWCMDKVLGPSAEKKD